MLDVIFRDEHLIAIHKPAGLLVHRSEIDRSETRFAIQLLRDQIGQRVFPVHRLDRGTSGVLLFALTREALVAANRAFELNEVDKTYLAVVRGWPDEHGEIDHPLTRQYDNHEHRPEGAGTEAQSALTRFKRLAAVELPIAVDSHHSTSRYALLQLSPKTGRRHQIRRHLKHIAHPIIGDSTHGKGIHNRMFAEHFGCRRMLLMCDTLNLVHPVLHTRLELCAATDETFESVLTSLGWQRPPSESRSFDPAGFARQNQRFSE
ncbi:pseudouridine synthase [Uliginosibacterium sp. 31-16]|uniref:pseudouridine synthase n=1 Tax=Uliginosibacterium sp. 31-16 TaxID=3068315 RepID=UPI00273DA67F|nr:pseudouridine synthase [Uliginosibacterium sp. 31-16]MDP5241243.1 pseudouridine synthase [Uliginosibacterium sp. 31-16]